MNLPTFEWLEDIPGRGVLVRLVGGEHSGDVVLLIGATSPVSQGRRVGVPLPPPVGRSHAESVARSDASEAKAESLLLSLLDPVQRHSWQRTGSFWVETRRGPVRLGRLYDLRYRPGGGRRELSLCVVPTNHRSLPEADIWVNLLLMLQADPDWFFRVAHHNRVPA